MGSLLAKIVNSNWACPLVLVVTAMAYVGALGADFVWDDFPLIVENPRVHSLGQWQAWFTEDLWAIEGVSSGSGFYRPLVLASFAVDEAVWGMNPLGFHLQSLSWHLGCVWLLFQLLETLVERRSAWVAAAVFALHPALSESVIWIAARNDLMATAFLLGMLLNLSGGRPRPVNLVLGWGCFLAALLSKESSVVGMGLLVCLDWARWGHLRGFRRYAGLGGTLLVWWWLRSTAGVSTGDLDLDAGLSLLAENGDQVLGIYARLLFWPFDLSVGRSLEYLSEPSLLTMVGLLGLGGMLAIAMVRGRRLALAGILFAAMSIAPAALAVASKAQIGERYLYLPLVGLSVVLASVLQRQNTQRMGVGLLMILAVGFAGIQKRTAEWADELSLWTAATTTDPSPYTWGNLGHMHNRRAEVLSERGAPEESVHRLQAMDALERSFHHALPYHDNCSALVRVPFRARDFERSLRHLKIGEDAGCLSHPSQGPDFAGLKGVVLAVNGHWEKALEALPAALEDPGGRGEVLRGALLLLEGSTRLMLPPLRSFCGSRPESKEDALVYDASVQRLLMANGLAVEAIFDDNDSAALFCSRSGRQ